MKKPLIIIIVLVILLLAGFAAYWFLYKDKGGSGGGSIFSSLNPNCKYNDPDLCKFINGWKEQKYYTVTSSTTDSGGKKSEMVMKVEGDDKSQVTGTEDGKEVYNFISIGNDSYSKDYTDGKWVKTTYKPDENTKSDANFDFDKNAESPEDKTTYKKIGTEKCDNLTCFKYQVIYEDDSTSVHYLYFDNKDYQLRKTRDEIEGGEVSESVLTYSKVTISTPSPVKEGASTGEIPVSVPTNIPTDMDIPDTSTMTPDLGEGADDGSVEYPTSY